MLKVSGLNKNLQRCKFSKLISIPSSYKIIIAGAGCGGIALAAKFGRKFKKHEIAIIDPAERHYYQPFFSFVTVGIKKVDDTWKPMESVIPKSVTYIKDEVVEFDPRNDSLTVSSGRQLKYEILIICVGTVPYYKKIPGLLEGLENKDSGVCTNYLPEYAPNVFPTLQKAKPGLLLFTYPNAPVKCPGAPQKAMYLCDDYLRRVKRRKNYEISYHTGITCLFAIEAYQGILRQICKKRHMTVYADNKLVEILPEKKEAIFKHLHTDKITTLKYSMLYVAPPHAPPKVLTKNKKLVNKFDYLYVNNLTLQHKIISNVFGIGDCTCCPTSKTCAAIACQLDVVYKNVLAFMKGKTPVEIYDGYASCPIITTNKTVLLAEFDYSQKPKETFPFSLRKESRFSFFLKKEVFHRVYWELMLKGYYHGPSKYRKILNLYLVADNMIPAHVKN